MPSLQVIASRPLSGKTSSAVARAQGFARDGAVRLVRLGEGQAANEDAATFATYLFASTHTSFLIATVSSSKRT